MGVFNVVMEIGDPAGERFVPIQRLGGYGEYADRLAGEFADIAGGGSRSYCRVRVS